MDIKKKSGICFVVLLSIMLLWTFFSGNYERYQEFELQNYRQNLVDYNKFIIRDAYDDPEISNGIFQFFKESDSLERLKSMNHDLNESFYYIEVITQSCEFRQKYTLPEIFCAGYEEGYADEMINQETSDGYITPVKAIQMNAAAYELSALDQMIFRGSGFSQEDFIISSDEYNIPVLLGKEYLPYYQVGEEIVVNYLSKDVTLEVKGFLQPNASAADEIGTVNLSRYIVMPSCTWIFESDDGDSLRQQKIIYSQKNTGMIFFAETDADQIRAYFQELTEKYDLLYNLYDITEGFDQDLRQSENSYIQLVRIKNRMAVVSRFVMLILILLYLAMNIYNIGKYGRDIAVYLICGGQRNMICKKMAKKILQAFLAALAVSLVIFFAVMNLSGYSVGLLTFISMSGNAVLFYLSLFILNVIAISVYIQRCNFVNVLKDKKGI